MKFRLAAAAAAVAAVTAGATYGATSLARSSAATTTIQACVKKANGDVRIVAGAVQCHDDEHAVVWNVQGPAGPKGDTGDKGAPGESVQGTALQTGDANCPFGGSSFAVGAAPATFACNGAPGAAGKDGKDGTSFTSIDGLNGLACTNAGRPGTVTVADGSNGAITLSCTVTSTGGGDTGGGPAPSCTPPPDPPHGMANCDANGAIVYACAYGWADTDGNLANGCEAQLDLQNDPHNCGSPGKDVSALYMHATAGCRNGTPYLLACDPGWSDEDGNPANGCEKSLAACAHQNGLGGAYYDCSDPLGTPGDASTYTFMMANWAANAWGGTPGGDTCPTGNAVEAVNGSQTAVWLYTGPDAGHVHVASTATCPTSTDPVWN